MVMQAMHDDCQWSVMKFSMVRYDQGAKRGPIASDMLEISHYVVTWGYPLAASSSLTRSSSC